MAFPSNPVNGQTTNINNVYYTYYTSIPGWTVSSAFNDNITAANVTVSDQLTAVSIVGTLNTAAQPNITSVGTLTSLNSGVISSSGNVTGANILTGGVVSAVGNVRGANFNTVGVVAAANIIGDGSQLTAIPGANVTGTVANATYATSAGTATTATSATTAGTVTTAAQPNITSVGTLTSLNSGAISSSGNITASYLFSDNSVHSNHLYLTGNAAVTGNVSAGNLETIGLIYTSGNVYAVGNVVATNLIGNLALAKVVGAGNVAALNLNGNASTFLAGDGTWLADTDIVYGDANVSAYLASGNNTAGFSTTGNVTAAYVVGNGSLLTNLPAANIVGAVASATTATTALAVAAGNITGTTLNSAVITSSLTSVGALNSGSITSGFGAIDIGVDTLTCGGIVNSNANGVGNIGSSTTYFNTVFAKATSAQYADLAEKYSADDEYAPGTVVVFGGNKEITTTGTSHDSRVAGVISTDPAYLMNSAAEGLPVAFTGRVPTLVIGPIAKGDIVVSSEIPGVGQKLESWVPGCVVGKSLEDIDSAVVKLIEVVVGRF